MYEKITELRKTKLGLSSEQVKANTEKYGTNKLTPKKVATVFEMFIESLMDPCVKIISLALVVKIVIAIVSRILPILESGGDDIIDIVCIFSAIALATGLSTVSEWKNTTRSSALQAEYSRQLCRVMRDGALVNIFTSEITYGDIINIQAGDSVPVDGILIDGDGVKVAQAALNGESRAEDKTPTLDIEYAESDKWSDNVFTNPHKLFMGSTVESGADAYMMATVLGDKSELGKINAALNDADENEEKDATTLKLEVLLGQINFIGMSAAILAGIINVVMGFIGGQGSTFGSGLALCINSFMLAVSIIIMAIPEGLATVVSLVQSVNTQSLFTKHILVSHKAAYSDASYLDIQFSDKTGTITYGVLKLVEFITGAGNVTDKASESLVNAITINNMAHITEEDGKKKATASNNMDRALLNYVIEHDYAIIDDSDLVISKSGFNSEDKCATAEMKDGTVYWKGATEKIIDEITHYNVGGELHEFTATDRKNLDAKMVEQCERAMKLLSVVEIKDNKKILLGVLCLRDDVREDARETVKTLAESGVTVIMVTGDNEGTAKAIAKDAEIYDPVRGDVAITHAQLADMTDDEVKAILPKLRVVSRAMPLDKQRLVKLAKEEGHIVGMTGDGVNDSPALKSSDVGFAMGDGTAVAKEAGDVVILNNSLSAIKDCILNSRTMAKSIGKFLIFQLTINMATLLMNIVAPLIGWTEPFTIVQILYINLIMDTLAALAFAGEPALDRYMKEKPVAKNAKILTPYILSAITVSSLFVGIGCVLLLLFGRTISSDLLGVTEVITDARVKTMMFSFFIYTALFNAFNTRSEKFNLFENIGQNKAFIGVIGSLFVVQTLVIQVLGKVFGTVPLSVKEFIFAFVLAALIIPIDFIRKAWISKNMDKFEAFTNNVGAKLGKFIDKFSKKEAEAKN